MKLYDLNLEKQIIKRLIETPDLLFLTDLKAQWFYNPEHQELFKLIENNILTSKPIDLVTLSIQLRAKRDGLEKILHTLPDISNLVGNIYTHACKTLHMYYYLRNIYLKTKEVEVQLKSIDVTNEQDIKQLENILMQTVEENDIKETDIAEVLQHNITILEKKMKGEFIYPVKSNFKDLNTYTNDWKSGLYVIAGRPAMGKTAFVNNMALNMAEQGTKVGIFYLETTASENLNRMLSFKSLIPLSAIQQGTITQDEFNKIIEVREYIQSLPIYIIDSNTIELIDLLKEIKKMKYKYDINIVFIDQLTHIRNSKHFENKAYEIEDTVRHLSDLRKQLDIPIVLMHQLNREVHARSTHRPGLSDLKSSGGIEQEADFVMFLHRPAYYKDPNEILPDDEGKAEWIVAKNRDGATGIIRVGWIGEYTKFEYIPDLGENF